MTVKRILFIDDEEDIKTLARFCIELESNWQLMTAASGQEGITLAETEQPDAILLDAVMPDMDGFTCCDKIRQLRGGELIPILMITVLDDQKSIDQAFNCGATDYITKPIHWAVLSQRMRRLLATNEIFREVATVKQKLHQQQLTIDRLCNLMMFLSS